VEKKSVTDVGSLDHILDFKMKKEENLIKLLHSIRNLLLGIRTNPKQSSINNILILFIKYLKIFEKSEDINLNNFIKDLKNINNFYIIDHLIKELKEYRIKNKNIDYDWIKNTILIFIDF
jgi:hypothetical protein